MNTKDISNFFHIDLFDIYERWETVEGQIVRSEFGKHAREVLDDAGKVIGRVLVEVLEDVAQKAVDKGVEVVTDKIKSVGKDALDEIKQNRRKII